ncbi:MAG TPA: hypothetical protein VKV74_14065 [Bryobacteraceae bacterium]|nr:hypothetical protein [Bryobacteraceae bacterium]
MLPDLAVALGWIGCAVALFSFLGVNAWVNARRREREAYYKSEAIKKIAELREPPPEPVLSALREALNPPPQPPSPWAMATAQAREFYRHETLKRIAELKGPDADAVLAVMREEERRAARRAREGLKLAGLISAGVGAGLFIFLQAIEPDKPVYLAGLIPLLVGAALLAYAFVFAPGE